MRKGTYKDLTGRRFGKLLVSGLSRLATKRQANGNTREAVFLCRCDCGVAKEVRAHELRQGQISCGCAIYEPKGDGREHARAILRAARQRAVKSGIDINIGVEDIVIPLVCPVLGIPLAKSKRVASSNSPSLDRIDPKKGYVKGNIWVISHRANTLKSDATARELIAVADALIRMGQSAV